MSIQHYDVQCHHGTCSRPATYTRVAAPFRGGEAAAPEKACQLSLLEAAAALAWGRRARKCANRTASRAGNRACHPRHWLAIRRCGPTRSQRIATRHAGGGGGGLPAGCCAGRRHRARARASCRAPRHQHLHRRRREEAHRRRLALDVALPPLRIGCVHHNHDIASSEPDGSLAVLRLRCALAVLDSLGAAHRRNASRR